MTHKPRQSTQYLPTSKKYPQLVQFVKGQKNGADYRGFSARCTLLSFVNLVALLDLNFGSFHAVLFSPTSGSLASGNHPAERFGPPRKALILLVMGCHGRGMKTATPNRRSLLLKPL
jgi:hypothetical protein